MSDPENIPDALRRVTFTEPTDEQWEARKWGGTDANHEQPDPLAPEFALSDADKAAVIPLRVVASGWVKHGDWKHRQFGREVQLRNARLPHVPLDLFRSEAEQLYEVLADVLSKPAPLPYRTPWHERLRMWLARKTWNRRHAAELDAARTALLEETLRGMPQMDDAK